MIKWEDHWLMYAIAAPIIAVTIGIIANVAGSL